MGDLAEHIAKVARMRFPDHAVPQEVRPAFLEAGPRRGDAGREGRHRDRHARTSRRPASWRPTTTRWTACTAACSASCCPTDWPYGVETAIDITLLGRYYERFADHAVSVARRVVYLVTGERHVPEASQP